MAIPMPPSKMSMVDAQALLAPYDALLGRVVHDAWDRVNEECAGILHELRPETIAGIVNDAMVAGVKQTFAGVSAVRLDETGEFFGLVVAERAYLRFKKLNRLGLPSNYRTQNQKSFYHLEELPGIPASLARLFVGYRLNLSQSAIQEVLVTCPNGRRSNAWSYSIERPSVTVIRELPSTSRKSRVQPKTKTNTINSGDTGTQ